MSTELAVPDQTFIALTPAQMGPAQAGLADWCVLKMRSLGKEYADLSASLKIATRNRWGSRQSLDRAVKSTRKRILYYKKIRDAVRAGFVVIPNFDIDVFAVRVDNAKPRHMALGYQSYQIEHAEPQLLNTGEGRYVSGKSDVSDQSYNYPDPQKPGQLKRTELYVRSGYLEEIDLPLLELKPQILESIEHALAQKVFDRLGIVKHRKRSDPIVVGQLIDPRHNNPINPVVISFFIAWWLNTEVL